MSSENGLLRGKRVVVLGASRGVGREIVRRASAEGALVLAVARQGARPGRAREDHTRR